MASIGNDRELREALRGLELEQQRRLGARFVGNVLDLCSDPRVRLAVEMAGNSRASAEELDEAYRGARAYSVKTYTDCGKDTDWLSQAAHFVAAAATACLTPETLLAGDTNPAWKAAMQARMARNCEMIEHQEGEAHNEAEVQYRLADEFLAETA